ncbi:hypothetical protein FHX59_004208 [Paraburkholderia silvatlantica]|uniref:Uncharacterized protein n=1 Tax=Paraburkholderia silvatlantica TaxID=321895 RepID=A0ABR6FQQ9_9BURK|nr:hypothetical protein [Paraburkholderia silvatlantica]
MCRSQCGAANRASYYAKPTRNSRETHAKFCAAKFQFTMFQNASTNFGRALR